LGVRLADRSSRRFRLTDEGLLLYERSCSILDQIRDAEAEVASRGGAARGLLKIGAPSDFGRRHLGHILALFTAQHPGVEAHLVLSDAGLENQADNCDVVLRFGLPHDPGMIARKMAITTRVLCASPSYLTRHGTPHSPDDLLRHNCLRLARRHHLDDLWRFRREGSEFEVRVRGNLSSGDGAVLHEWALSGEGISWEALWDVSEDLASGRLVHVLREFESSPMELYAIFAPGKPVPPRIRLFVDHIAQAFARFRPSSSNTTGAQANSMMAQP
jgi:LysR family transcriptional regulator, transcriptional activator for dmlA